MAVFDRNSEGLLGPFRTLLCTMASPLLTCRPRADPTCRPCPPFLVVWQGWQARELPNPARSMTDWRLSVAVAHLVTLNGDAFTWLFG